jgi:hypothetical protein
MPKVLTGITYSIVYFPYKTGSMSNCFETENSLLLRQISTWMMMRPGERGFCVQQTSGKLPRNQVLSML